MLILNLQILLLATGGQRNEAKLNTDIRLCVDIVNLLANSGL